ncbi:hypothetical protein Fmac_029620 [Flemingia macrophylla]|uniref:Uncharacterized protein n=1 Tax=Flemingia macrophylla TaxID=520843 RepID=A0ABD1LAV7_9FABA
MDSLLDFFFTRKKRRRKQERDFAQGNRMQLLGEKHEVRYLKIPWTVSTTQDKSPMLFPNEGLECKLLKGKLSSFAGLWGPDLLHDQCLIVIVQIAKRYCQHL